MPRVAVLVLPELSAAAKMPTVLTATALKPVAVAESIGFVLTLNRAGIKATADWGPATRQLRVCAGSTAMLEDRISLGLGSAALRKKLLQQKILVKQADQLLFDQGYLFESVMQAAEAVCGYSMNGKQAWRYLTENPLADYVN